MVSIDLEVLKIARGEVVFQTQNPPNTYMPIVYFPRGLGGQLKILSRHFWATDKLSITIVRTTPLSSAIQALYLFMAATNALLTLTRRRFSLKQSIACHSQHYS